MLLIFAVILCNDEGEARKVEGKTGANGREQTGEERVHM